MRRKKQVQLPNYQPPLSVYRFTTAAEGVRTAIRCELHGDRIVGNVTGRYGEFTVAVPRPWRRRPGFLIATVRTMGEVQRFLEENAR